MPSTVCLSALPDILASVIPEGHRKRVSPLFKKGGGGSCMMTTKIKLDDICPIDKNSEYDQEIPQSQTADNPMAPRERAAQPPRDTRKTN